MKNKIVIIIITTIIIATVLIATGLLMLVLKKEDYQKLELDIESYDIDSCMVYYEDFWGTYKVYKLNKTYVAKILDGKLNENEYWSTSKYYEYVMFRFYEDNAGERIEIDRENLYYYYGKGAYAILDAKNEKLFYLEYPLEGTESDYNELLDMTLSGYINKEVYSVKDGWQGDGQKYYTYIFNKETGNEIAEKLSHEKNWTKEKLDEEVLDCYEYNEEVKSIQNGYYYYKEICRTSDENKKYNFTIEEATGYETAIYDIDNNVLYYIWESI